MVHLHSPSPQRDTFDHKRCLPSTPHACVVLTCPPGATSPPPASFLQEKRVAVKPRDGHTASRVFLACRNIMTVLQTQLNNSKHCNFSLYTFEVNDGVSWHGEKQHVKIIAVNFGGRCYFYPRPRRSTPSRHVHQVASYLTYSQAGFVTFAARKAGLMKPQSV